MDVNEPAARGVFGGTFDPPHLGHLILAEAARSHLQLERLLWMPAAQPPHKRGRRITPTAQRIEMVQRAIAGNPRFSLSLLDAEGDGPSYSVDLMQRLREEWGAGVPIFFLIGGDSLLDLPTWYKPQRLMELVTFAVIARPTYQIDMDALEQALPGIRERVVWVPAPLIGISSTELRAAVRAGDSIRYRVPESVREYVEEQGLYREDGAQKAE